MRVTACIAICLCAALGCQGDEGLALDADCFISLCRMYGRCTRKGDHCVAASDQDCAQSLPCTYEGRCTWDGKTHCAIRSDADCRQSDECTDHGRCAYVEDRGCVPGAESHCASSVDCLRFGACSYADNRCVK